MDIAMLNNNKNAAALDDPLKKLPGYALRRAANAAMAELAERLATIELRVSDASVLLLVRSRTDATASEIGRTLDIQRANMVPLLNRLEAAGLIERTPLDRKSNAIIVTTKGQTTLTQVDKITAKFENELISRIPAEHREHFLPALNALWK